MEDATGKRTGICDHASRQPACQVARVDVVLCGDFPTLGDIKGNSAVDVSVLGPTGWAFCRRVKAIAQQQLSCLHFGRSAAGATHTAGRCIARVEDG